ncbi:MAG: DMT family transporter [Acidimicrobiales bacterium]
MTRTRVLGVAAPLIFVFLWSTGYVGARYGLPDAPPFTLLAIRMALAGALLGVAAKATRTAFPRGEPLRRSAITGLLLHGGYLGGVFLGISLGVPAGLSAVIVNIQPVLTSVLAGRYLNERVTRRQWVGLVLGFAGVSLAVGEKLTVSGDARLNPWGLVATVVALVAATAGTIHHKRHGGAIALLSGTAVQYGAALVAFVVVALAFERGEPLRWTPRLLFALGWMVLVLSLGAILLLLWLIRTNSASSVSSLLYLVPPLTAVEAYLLFDERFGLVAAFGAALAVIGVALVRQRPAPGVAGSPASEEANGQRIASLTTHQGREGMKP